MQPLPSKAQLKLRYYLSFATGNDVHCRSSFVYGDCCSSRTVLLDEITRRKDCFELDVCILDGLRKP